MARQDAYRGWQINYEKRGDGDRMSAAQKAAIQARKAKRDKLENDRLCSELGIYDLRDKVLNDDK